MPVKSRNEKTKLMSPENSLATTKCSPSHVLRRSPRNGNQPKITSMFTSKRNRSPESPQIMNPKKLKYDEEIEEHDKNDIKEQKSNSPNLHDDITIDDVHGDSKPNNNSCNSSKDVLEATDIQIKQHPENVQNDNKDSNENNNNSIKPTDINMPDTEKCVICGQFLNNSDLVYYQGHPQNAVEEYIALTNEKLVLASVFRNIYYKEKGRTITGEYYATILEKLKDAIKEKRRGKLTKGVLLLQDNAPVHKSKVAMAALHTHGFESLVHPPYSPDLAPSDFYLFPNLKKDLRGRKFSDDNEVKEAILAHFEGKDKKYFYDGLEKLIHRSNKCIQLKGDYIEKEK